MRWANIQTDKLLKAGNERQQQSPYAIIEEIWAY